MNISTTDAQPLFTKKLVARFSDRLKPKSFLRSFFTEVESDTKEISIQVERNFEKIAVDVLRGTEGNRNVFDRSTEKLFVPPYYREYFEGTDLKLYDALYAEPQISAVNFGKFLDDVAEKLDILMDKIDRSYELQAAQVLQTGIVTLEQGVNIDFKRKALSMVDLTAGGYWTGGSVDPNTSLLTGARFLREKGKSGGNEINAIFGGNALSVYLANAAVQKRGAMFQYGLDKIVQAQREALGQTLHGQISVGEFRINIWTYSEIYTDAQGVDRTYIDEDTVILLPQMPKFVLSYAAVPQLLSTGVKPKKGKFLVDNYIDQRKTSHVFDVKSAGVAIPVAVDQIYTMKVVE